MADKTFMVEDAQILFRNFSGRETEYNRAGSRNFTIALDPAVVPAMLEDGWNVRELKPREEGDTPTPVIEIAVGYKFKPPRIMVITSVGRTMLGEESVDILDDADITTMDLIARAREWEVGGKTGTKAYLQSAYVTINEDPLQRKYGLGVGTPVDEGEE